MGPVLGGDVWWEDVAKTDFLWPDPLRSHVPSGGLGEEDVPDEGFRKRGTSGEVVPKEMITKWAAPGWGFTERRDQQTGVQATNVPDFSPARSLSTSAVRVRAVLGTPGWHRRVATWVEEQAQTWGSGFAARNLAAASQRHGRQERTR